MRNLSVWANAAVFLVAAATIWWAGTRLERDADRIARRTGLGHAFTGMLLLAAVTSLPEVATTITAVAILDNPTLAVHNLLGGVALQTAILVVADAVKPRRGALTFFSPRYIVLIEGLGVVFLLQITIAGTTARGVPTIGAVSTWVIALATAYLLLMYIVYRDRGQSRWTPSRMDDVPAEVRREASADEANDRAGSAPWASFGVMSVLVLVGGWLATQTVDALAEQTGVGSAFLGATALAAATSFPELSTTIAAVRNDRYVVAISNVFGSNAFDITLLVLAEVLYASGTIFAHVEGTVVFAATIGAVMTCLYLWGLMERRNRTILRLGWDSAAAVLVYIGGIAVLYVIQ